LALNPITKKPWTQSEFQGELNRINADEKRKWKEANRKTIDELENLKNRASTSEEDKTRLQTQIDQLNSDMQTKEEQQKTALTKLQDKYDGDTKKYLSERDTWKGRFESEKFQNEIAQACRVKDREAFDPGQISALLSPNKKFVEEIGADGKPTGQILTKITFRKPDKDGKDVVLDLSVEETVKTMFEMPDKYGNLFKATVKSGFGENNSNQRMNGKKVEDMSNDEYEKSRLEILAQSRAQGN
jgi:hypothetical protein